MLPNTVGSGTEADDVNSPKVGMSGSSAGVGAVAAEPSTCVVSLTGKSARAVWNGVTGKGLDVDLARQFEMIRFIAFHIGVASSPLASIVFFNASKARDRNACRLGASKLGMSSSETICMIGWKHAWPPICHPNRWASLSPGIVFKLSMRLTDFSNILQVCVSLCFCRRPIAAFRIIHTFVELQGLSPTPGTALAFAARR